MTIRLQQTRIFHNQTATKPYLPQSDCNKTVSSTIRLQPTRIFHNQTATKPYLPQSDCNKTVSSTIRLQQTRIFNNFQGLNNFFNFFFWGVTLRRLAITEVSKNILSSFIFRVKQARSLRLSIYQTSRNNNSEGLSP